MGEAHNYNNRHSLIGLIYCNWKSKIKPFFSSLQTSSWNHWGFWPLARLSFCLNMGVTRYQATCWCVLTLRSRLTSSNCFSNGNSPVICTPELKRKNIEKSWCLLNHINISLAMKTVILQWASTTDEWHWGKLYTLRHLDSFPLSKLIHSYLNGLFSENISIARARCLTSVFEIVIVFD